MTRVALVLIAIPAVLLLARGGSGDPLLPDPLDPTPGFPQVGEPRFLDAGDDPDATTVWGRVECTKEERHTLIASGGDGHLRADREPQGNDSYRRLRLRDGDEFYGERCELGLNDHRTSPVALYREGDRSITFISLRLPPGFPLHTRSWQVLMQIKQSQPADGGNGSPRLALQAADGRWILTHAGPSETDVGDGTVWSAPARIGVWTRFAFDVVYSADPSVGSVRLSADLNGDGDARDAREQSGVAKLQTLRRERAGGSDDGLTAGDPIPSHLRAGLYHDPEIRCPRRGCFVDVDNVAVHLR